MSNNISPSYDAIIENAIKELKEESANVFQFKKKDIEKAQYIDILNKDRHDNISFYRCFIICITGANKLDKFFNHNKKIILSTPKYMKSDWNETTGIIKISFNKVKECFKHHNILKNTYCDKCILHSRSIKCLNLLLNTTKFNYIDILNLPMTLAPIKNNSFYSYLILSVDKI
jgi:hypothetical protein